MPLSSFLTYKQSLPIFKICTTLGAVSSRAPFQTEQQEITAVGPISSNPSLAPGETRKSLDRTILAIGSQPISGGETQEERDWDSSYQVLKSIRHIISSSYRETKLVYETF